MDLENAYQALGLEAGPESTEADIKKAYRKLALAKHPDKNPDNPNAAAEFAELQRVYAILTDPEARKALDDLLRAKAQRAERAGVRDEKRRRMMDELERREKAVQRERSQEEIARAKLKVEIERLRKQAAEREAKLYAEQRKVASEAAAATAAASAVGAGAGEAEAGQELRDKLSRTLKVSWLRKDGEYSVAQLRAIFAAHGLVDDVVLREGKKKKGSALVVMASGEGAASAAGSVCGDLSNPLLVVPFPKGDDLLPVPPPPQAAQQPQAAGPSTAAAGLQPQPPAAFAAAAPRAPPAGAAAPLFAAAAPAAAAGPSLPPRPTAPLFAAGGAGFPAGNTAERGGALGARPPSGFSLFPGGGGAAAGSSGTAGQGEGVANGEAAAAAGPGRPLFATAAGGAGAGAASGLGGFSSYRPPPAMQSATALNRELEADTLRRLQQAAERQRLINELQQQEGA